MGSVQHHRQSHLQDPVHERVVLKHVLEGVELPGGEVSRRRIGLPVVEVPVVRALDLLPRRNKPDYPPGDLEEVPVEELHGVAGVPRLVQEPAKVLRYEVVLRPPLDLAQVDSEEQLARLRVVADVLNVL